MSRTREEDSSRLLRCYKEALEMAFRLDIQVKLERGNASEELYKRKREAEARAHRIRGTLYRMIVSSTEEFRS